MALRQAHAGLVAHHRGAVGQPMSAPETKLLMRQSTSLAASLTQLIQAVRGGDIA